MDIYCSKCRKKTSSTNIERLKTANNKWRLKAICVKCKHEKSTFIKAPTASEVVQYIKPIESKDLLVEAKELHRGVVRKFQKRRIITLGIDDLWAADLVIMDKYASENNGYKYMLNVIDTFSKYAWAEPLSRKNGVDVTKAFVEIINRANKVDHTTPNLLHTDKGGEFVNSHFKSMLENYGIKMYHTENEEKSAIVERFNRTLNELMKIQFEVRQSFRWVDMLQGLLDIYNNRFHSTIRMKPSAVNKINEDIIKQLFTDKIKHSIVTPKYHIGDRVRIVSKKDRFSNKYRRNWTREIFTITHVLNTDPHTYKIKDQSGESIIGSFYEKELQKSMF